MKPTAIAIALALGIALGLGLRGTVFEAEAKPPAPQQREDQIVIVSSPGYPGLAPCEPTGYSDLLTPGTKECDLINRERLLAVEVNTAEYPPDAIFWLETTLRIENQGTFCVRLFDNTTSLPVPGGEICRTNTNPSIELAARERTALTLAEGTHEYSLQGKEWQGALYGARIIVDWTEGGKGR